MPPVSCDTIRAALLQTLTDSRQPLQGLQIAQGFARCPECLALRGELLGRLLPGATALPDSCDHCQDDLAAYVDLSLDAGAQAAVVAYPHVWWHLWTCSPCAELFARTAALALAERDGSPPPPV